MSQYSVHFLYQTFSSVVSMLIFYLLSCGSQEDNFNLEDPKAVPLKTIHHKTTIQGRDQKVNSENLRTGDLWTKKLQTTGK